MDQIRRIIHECHRRSLWQVLIIYLVGSWGVLQAIQGVTQTAGLPDWVPPGALVLLMIGLPVVLATAFVQEGIGSAPQPWPADAAAAAAARHDPVPAQSAPFLTWRRAVVGGVVAFAVLIASVGVYTLMWAKGVGPVGSLVAQGVLDERERILLADFGNATGDSLLDDVVTEAIRVDRQLIAVFFPTAFAPLVQEELGELYQALGRRAEAAAAYDKVVELWQDADPVLQPRVERAREKAQALRAAAAP